MYFKTIKNIISKDNTHPIIIKTYLTLLNKFNQNKFSKKFDFINIFYLKNK